MGIPCHDHALVRFRPTYILPLPKPYYRCLLPQLSLLQQLFKLQSTVVPVS